MQTLLVDLGNSRLKWAFYDGSLPLASAARVHREQELAAVFASAWASEPRPDRVLVASVADQARRDALEQWLQQQWALTPTYLVSPAQGQGIRNRYAEPARLGCDRWAAMVAAYHAAHTAVCVVDCGTAVTLDVVDSNGQHLGGMILPGLRAMHAALSQHTALPPVDVARFPAGLLGTTTEECITVGSVQAIRALIEQTVADLAQQQGLQARCYLTGGNAEQIVPLLSIPYELEPDLVLQGLAVIADAT